MKLYMRLTYPANLLYRISRIHDDDSIYYEYTLSDIRLAMRKHLSEREEKVLRMRYEYLMTLEHIGNILGVTKVTISGIELRALRKLRKHSRDYAIYRQKME